LEFFVTKQKKQPKNPMIETIVTNFQSFRKHLFQLFRYRAGATLDLIDAVAATINSDSIVKFSLSQLFRRKYSSITDVLNSLFRIDLKRTPTATERKKQISQLTQLLAEESVQNIQGADFALFAIDCTAHPRIYAKKVSDRTIVHASNQIPGQKPVTVGHEYSVLVHLPNQEQEQKWVIPLSVQRVPGDQKGPDVGLAQLNEVLNQTDLKNYFCVNVSDTAYSQRNWIIKIDQWPHVVHLARMRGNRKLYRLPLPSSRTKCGRPRIYGDVFLLNNPSQPDYEECITTTSRKGKVWKVTLQRWNDLLATGSKTERTHEHPFDLVRVIVKDETGQSIYRRPLWVMIAGLRRKEISSLQVYESYTRRYDIEHFFRFGKQKLGLVNSQTSETLHEENWQWIALLAYNMLYRVRGIAQSIRYPWEKKRISVINTVQRPTQVQRDYERIIREIGTPAPIPKPRGNPVGRKKGQLGKRRYNCPLIQKNLSEDELAEPSSTRGKRKKLPRKRRSPYTRIKRIWAKERAPPTRLRTD
jgi:hypothetical protein